mmetsp:Transcript_26066/g.68396  ORF Transcript_26066/g.68396 Transcript_26066/m.68396 type:complete len:201 (+) Transcript_26066:1025-1627(+)
MWLQPPFFSIVLRHLGHSFVFAAIQFVVSESSSFFLRHRLYSSHRTGEWGISLHAKQNSWPPVHRTGRGRCADAADEIRTASSQSTPGQNLTRRFPFTKRRATAAWYLRKGMVSPGMAWRSSVSVVWSTNLSHDGHGMAARYSSTSPVTYSVKQSVHTVHRQSSRVTRSAAKSSIQMGHSTNPSTAAPAAATSSSPGLTQ